MTDDPLINANFDFSTATRDLAYLVFGKRLGCGQFRSVYVYRPDPTLVIKVELAQYSFANVKEHAVWQDAEHMDWEIRKWLAPVEYISGCGTLLLQHRTSPAINYPDKIPSWMTDTKKQNFGMLDGRFVCHDYGTHLICNSGMTKRLRKADWWSDEDDQ